MSITGIGVIRRNPGVAVGIVAGEKIELTYGDTLKVNAAFDYRGLAGSATLYGAIGNRGWAGFDEILHNEVSINLPESPADFTPCERSVEIGITSDIDPGTDYDLYCKIKEFPEAGMPEVDDVIDIVGFPPTYELIEETIYPYAYVYDGPHDGGILTFTTDPFTPASWIAGVLAGHVEDEVRKSGGRVMEMRVYVDKSPLLWADWRVEVITAPPKTTAGTAMSLGIAWWAVAILLALALAIIIAITYLWKEVAGTFKRTPGLEDVKPGWGKETLILTIQDSEEYWERTPTPVETLEGMSEGELREYLDKIAEEEVPPEVEGLGLAIAAAAVLGVGALAVAAYALSRPKKAVK